MQLKIYLTILIAVLVACSPGGKRPVHQTNSASINEAQKAELEHLIKEQLEKRDENGNVSELEGFSSSEGISSLESAKTTSLADLKAGSDSIGNNPIKPEEEVFEFIPPEGIQAEFSEPVMIHGASLALLNTRNHDEIEAICAGLQYFPEEPTIRDILELSKRENVCGPQTFNFCIRLSVPGSEVYTYAQSPNLYLDLPCPEETFTGAKIEIDYGRSETEATTTIVDIFAKNSVTEVYLTNSPGCNDGGNWENVTQDDPQWTLNWVDNVAAVFAKFKDVFGQESQCFFDTIAFGTREDKCFAYEPGFLPDNILSGVTIAGLEGSGGDYPICSRDGQIDCVTSSAFKAIKIEGLADKLLDGNTVAGVGGTAIAQTYSNCTASNQKDCITTATYKSMDLSQAGTSNGVLDSNFISRILSASEFEFWDASGNRHTATGDADITSANIVADKEIFGVSGTAGGTPDCSSISVGGDWILVPGDSDYGTNDFCVMKYEAKCSAADGSTCAIATHSPLSQASNTPWVNIDQQDSKTECASLGKGYHLITNDEWMTIASNIAAQNSNWSSGTVGTGSLFRGHSDDSPTVACPADSNDANAFVEDDAGTDCTAYPTGTENDESTQRRTHTLSNGQVIWDLSGNVWEWTSYFNDSDKPYDADDLGPVNNWREYTLIDTFGSAMAQTDLISQAAITGGWSSTHSIGQYYAGVNDAGGALARGGGWNYTTDSGVFAARPSLGP